MDDERMLAIKAWESFYVIVGSSAGALAGLQFVVLTLISEAGMLRGGGETLAAFGSPNVVHFCVALLVAALCSAPWPGATGLGVALALCGAGGAVYVVVVMRRSLRQRDYQPVLEDWTWHGILPMLAYLGCLVGGLMLGADTTAASFLVGGGSLLLVFIGIHNAWDTVTYVMLERARTRASRRPSAPTAPTAPVPPAPAPPGSADG